MTTATMIITVAAAIVGSDIDAYPVHIDLSTVPSTFWDNVLDGSDMRARSFSGGEVYPMDICSFDKPSKTGHLFVLVPVKAAGNQFRIDIGDDTLTIPDPKSLIGRYKVWQHFGPVYSAFASEPFRRPWSYTRYPGIDTDGYEIYANGGFYRTGRPSPPDGQDRSFSWIGRRTNTLADAALWSSSGGKSGDTDRETLYLRDNGQIGLWNSVDGWLSAGAWIAGRNTHIGATHENTVARKLYQNGALIATDTGTVDVPNAENWRFLAVENHDMKALLTGKFQFAYIYAGILSADWFAFEYANWFFPSTTLSYSVINFTEYLNMSILFAGTSIADFFAAGSPAAETNAAKLNSYCAEGISIISSGDGSSYIDIAGEADFWLADYLQQTSGSGAAATGLAFWNTAYSTTNPLFKITAVSGSSIPDLYYWNGSAHVQFDSGTAVNALSRWDIHVKVADTGGLFELYRNGVLDADFTSVGADTKLTAATTINRISFGCIGVGTTVWSGIIIADEDTRGITLVQRLPNGNGAQTAWTGAYTDVDETGYNDADFITSGVANDVETYTFADLPTEFANSPIAALIISGRMQGSAISPTGIQGVARIGSTNYAEDTERSLTTTFGPGQVIFAQNPDTASEWTAAAVNAAEFGVKSKT